MKQVIQNYRNGKLAVEEVPAPVIRPGGILVATHASLISVGTEKSTVSVAKKNLIGKAIDRPDMVRKVLDKAQRDGIVDTVKMVSSRLDMPVALGYSAAGRVLEVGREAEEFVVGDRVACAGQNYASHAEAIFVPKNLCVKIPGQVSFEEAAYVTLGAIAMQGIRQAEPRLGDIVAVIGLGLLGQLTVQILKANGCRVVASDPIISKLDTAAKFGADYAVQPSELAKTSMSMTGNHGVDAVIITASTKSSDPVEDAGEIARRKGRVVVVGDVGMDLPRAPYYEKELELRLSTSYGPGRYDPNYEEKGVDYPYGYVRWTEKRNMEAFLGLVAEGKVNVKDLTSHRFAIDQAEAAYNVILQASEPCLGVLLSYPRTEASPWAHRIKLRSTPKPSKVRLGIIGAGNHVKDMLLPALRGIADVNVAAVCTQRGTHAKTLAAKIGAEYCTSNYEDILNDDTINAVIVGTRHDTHARIVLEALRADKHVFVEKPLCLTEPELNDISTTYAEKAEQGLRLAVGFNQRWSAHLVKAREAFARRTEPLVMTYRVNAGALPKDHWAQDLEVGGGRIIGEACHFVDYLQELAEAPVTSVFAQCVGRHSSGIMSDQTVISLRFADGSIGTIIYTAGGDTALAKERCEVFGNGISLVMDDFMRTEIYAGGRKTSFKTRTRDKGFPKQMIAFCDSLFGANGTVMPFEGIYIVTRACLLAVKSLQTGLRYDV